MKEKTEQTNAPEAYSFAAEQWDVEGWSKELERVSDMALDFSAGFNTLEKYDLPRDVETLKKFGEYADPTKWKLYIMSLYSNYISKLGYVPKSERNRIREEYMTVAKETESFIIGMANAIAMGCVLAVDKSGYVEVDEDATLEPRKKKYIRKIDTRRMSGYWGKIVAATTAVTTLKNFEECNGLAPSVYSTTLLDPISRRMISGDENLDPRTFEKYMWRKFIKS